MSVGRRIAAEEMRNNAGHHNDHGDGMRHAVWSRRMAEEVGPGFSAPAGVQHEIEGLMRKGAGAEKLTLNRKSRVE